MKITGVEFENLVKPFFEKLFDDIGFVVLDVRNQNSGTQNGFDLILEFLDSNNIDRQLFVECKYYDSKLSYTEILKKIFELNSSNYTPDGFIALSPKVDLSNIEHNVHEGLQQSFKFPMEFWTPSFKIEEMFALDADLFKKVYNKNVDVTFDRQKRLDSIKAKIDLILAKKDVLQVANIIEIEEAKEEPNETKDFKTNLDEKLNSVFDESNEIRLRLHQYRCNYKIYLEKLEDLNNILRNNILKWQDNLRIKADRLTFQFQSDPNYTPVKFYHDFFIAAENSLNTFFSNHDLSGDDEKLLHGVVLELAAECPLNWKK